MLKSTSDSHYEFVFKDKTDGKYKHFGWGMVKKAYSPQIFEISDEKIRNNDFFDSYKFYLIFQ